MSAGYTVLEGQRIPMRDGIELIANIWLPTGGGDFPVILLRTPYSISADEYQRLGFQRYIDAGYAVVCQMVRGLGESEGEFGFFFVEGEDGYDSIEWIAAQSWCDGNVAMDGGSYLGTVQWLAAREQPPHLRCIIPSVPAGDYFNELPYKGGALGIDWAASWLTALAGGAFEFDDHGATHFEDFRPISSIPEKLGVPLPLLDEILEHPLLDDYWRRIYFDDADFRKVRVPVMTVTGWFDGDQAGSLFYWRGIEKSFPQQQHSNLVIGPWMHAECYLGGLPELGEMQFTDASVLPIQQQRIAFLDAFMKNRPDDLQQLPRVQVFITGSNRWHAFDQYPPLQCEHQQLYLHAGAERIDGRLSDTPAAADTAIGFTYTPAAPLPYRMATLDHLDLESRDDVVLFSTTVLEQALTVLGPVQLTLHAATDGRDTDFVAKLLDVAPDGKAISLSQMPGVMRARYRNGYEREELVVPDQPFKLDIMLPEVGHCFLPGHRLRLEISSSCFPLVDPNTNTGDDFRSDCTTRVARQQIFIGAALPSVLNLSILG
jgi:putative CocE/NonD family hydrolase